MRNLFQYIGFRHLKLKPARVLLTTLGVAFGISLYVAIAIINHSTKNSLRDNVEAIAGKSQLTISAGPAGFDEAKLEAIRTTEGVKAAVPLIEARAFFKGATESTEGLYVLGVDLLQETSVRSYKATDQRIIDDPLTFLNQPDSIVITKALAAKRNLAIDSKMELATAHGMKTFTVRGLLEPEGAAKAYGGSFAIMDIDGARLMFAKENKLDRVDIVPVRGFSMDALKANLEKSLGTGFTLETPESQSQQLQQMVDSYQLVLTFFSSLALLVGLFLVMNSISVAVAERKKEIGTLRALGATRLSMVSLFVTEIFGVSLIGSILGCGLGRLLAEKLSTQVTNSVAAQFQTRIEITRLEFTPHQFLVSVALGVGASLLAALIPAAKAAQVHPLESMKKHAESMNNEDEKRSHFSVLLGFGLLVFMTLSMLLEWGKIWIGLDALTKASSVLGAALFGPVIVFILFHLVRKLTYRLPFPVFRLSQENLIRSRKRTTSNIMALMVGLFLVVLIASVRSSFHTTLMNWLDRAFIADLMVTSNGRMITADVQTLKDDLQAEVLKVPGVRQIGEGRGIGSRVVPIQYHGKKIMIKALDHYADFYDYRNLYLKNADRHEVGNELYRDDGPRVLATHNFLTRQNKKVGEFVELNTPSGRIPFRIIAEVVDYASPEGVFYMNRATYKHYWKDPMVTAFLVNLEPGYSLEQVRSAIDARMGRKWNTVTISNAEFRLQMEGAIDRSFAYTRAIEIIALLVGLLGLLNTLLISVMERTREIGMLRAVGITRSQVVRMILSEASLQGFFGAVVAVLLGAYVGMMFIRYGLATTLGWNIDFYFPRESILTTLILGVAVSVLAGLLPAYRAANLNITEALDYE